MLNDQRDKLWEEREQDSGEFMLETSCAARAALLELFLWQRKTMEIGAAFWCAVDREHRTSSKTGLAQRKWQQCVLDIERKSAGKNPKTSLVCLSTDWRKRLALKERKHYVWVQQQTTTIVACIDRLKARFAVKKYAGKRPQTVWGVGSQCTRYKEQLWNSNRQTRAAYSVRACPIETQMDKSQEPFYVKFYRKNADSQMEHPAQAPAFTPTFSVDTLFGERIDSQMEHPAQAPAFTPTIRTLQCGHTVWEKKTLKRQVCRLPKESGVFVKSHKQKKKSDRTSRRLLLFLPNKKHQQGRKVVEKPAHSRTKR